MKNFKIFSILFLFFVSSTMWAQTASQLSALQGEDATAQAPSAKNPWNVGASLTFVVKDLDGSLENNFIFAGQASSIIAQGDKYAFPLYGSIGLGSEDVLSGESGFNLGIYPYYSISKTSTLEFLVHGGFGYKVIPAEGDLEATNQFKILGGVEGHFYLKDQALPTTLSITPTAMWHNGLEDVFVLEGTLIIPVGAKIGVLAEYQYPLGDDYEGIFRIGVITTKAL